MSKDVLNALNQIDKLLPEAKQQFKKMDPDYKVPAGIFEGGIKKFELAIINKKLVLKTSFNIKTHPDTNYSGCEAQAVMFLNSAFGIAKAMELFVQVGVTSAGKVAKGKDFQNLVNAANKIKSLFAVDLSYRTYEGKDYASLRIVRKLNEEIEAETPVETPEEIEPETPQEEEILDDFKDDFESTEPVYQEEIPELPIEEPEEEKPKTGEFDKLADKLKAFCFINLDLNVKDKTADEIVAIIKEKRDFFDIKQIDADSRKLLKKINIK